MCEVSDMGSGNCTLVLCKSRKHSELQSHLSSLSLRDLEMRPCWVRVVNKSSRTCSNKARDGEKGHSRKEGCLKSGARAGVAVAEPRVLATQ